jgi:hypothetical protein
MATAKRSTDAALILPYIVAATKTATEGCAVVHDGADGKVDTASAGSDLVIGIALHAATAGQPVSIQCSGLCAVKVGAGGATRGKKAVVLNDGKFEDAPAHDSDGTGNQAVYGVFHQSGVNGDLVGMVFYPSNRGS